MSVLGYADTRILFTDRLGNRITHLPTREVADTSWSRVVSEVSQCSMVVTAPPTQLRNLEPWLHHALVYRQEQLVWRGVVYTTEVTRAGLTMIARDPSVYFDRRRIAQDRTFFQTDLATIAAQLIRDAMALDDPFGVLSRMVVEPTGIYASVTVHADERYVAEQLKDLVEAGLTWTNVGGRMLVGPVARKYTTAPVTDRDIDGDFAVTKDGSETATDALVLGKGVQAQWFEQSPLGVLQTVEKQDALTNGYMVENAARRAVKERSITPRRVTLPSSTRLAPTAPISIEELVPGAIVPVQTQATGVEVNARMQLAGVEVKLAAGAEEVSVSLADEPAELTPLELTPPPSGYATEDDNPTYEVK